MERVDANLVPFAQNNSSGYRFAFGTDTATDDINVNYNDNIKKGWGTTPNEFPEVEDFNAMVYTIGYLLSYLYHMGIAEWNDKQKYRQYSRVIGSDGIIYKAKTGTDISPNVNNDPTEDTTNWEIDNQFNINSLIDKTTPTDTDNFVIQEVEGLFKKLSWANLKTTLFGSPTLTGTPTAPTQSAQDNSTKIATTAYVDGKMVLGTAINSTSGTSVDFTGIPNWAKKITIILSSVSTNGDSIVKIQLGSTAIQTTGYVGSGTSVYGPNLTVTTSTTTGIPIYADSAGASRTGLIELIKISGNSWVASGVVGSGSQTAQLAGRVTLSGALDRVRITTTNGTDIFDDGEINIMYEG